MSKCRGRREDAVVTTAASRGMAKVARPRVPAPADSDPVDLAAVDLGFAVVDPRRAGGSEEVTAATPASRPTRSAVTGSSPGASPRGTAHRSGWRLARSARR